MKKSKESRKILFSLIGFLLLLGVVYFSFIQSAFTGNGEDIHYDFSTGEDISKGYTIYENTVPAIQTCGNGECLVADADGQVVSIKNYEIGSGSFSIEMWMDFNATGQWQGDFFGAYNWRQGSGDIPIGSSYIKGDIDSLQWTSSEYGTSGTGRVLTFSNDYSGFEGIGGIGGTGIVQYYFANANPSDPYEWDGWKLITLVYNDTANTFTLYANGQTGVYSEDTGVEWLSSNEESVLAGDPTSYHEISFMNYDYYDNELKFDEVSFYSHALTQTEVINHFEAQKSFLGIIDENTYHNVSVYHNPNISIDNAECDSSSFDSEYDLATCSVLENTNFTIQWSSEDYDVTNDVLTFNVTAPLDVYITYENKTIIPPSSGGGGGGSSEPEEEINESEEELNITGITGNAITNPNNVGDFFDSLKEYLHIFIGIGVVVLATVGVVIRNKLTYKKKKKRK